MRNRTRKTTKTKTPLREGEHGTAERAEAERANSAAGAWAERGPAAFVEAAAGAEGQDALARSVDAFDLARKHDKAEALRVLSVEAWLWAGYLGLSRVDPDLGLAADTVRSVAHSGLTALRDRFARTPAGGRLSALTVVWRARTRPAITARRDPILPRITLEPVNAPRARGGLIVAPVSGRAGLGDTSLPLFPDAPQYDIAVPILDVADVATGVRAVSRGHGVTHELRLLFEGITSLESADRGGDGVLVAWTVGELMRAFYARGGRLHRAGRPGDWELIRRACVWIDHAAIPWRVPSGNLQSWLLMRVRSLAGERPAQTDPVVFDVRLPPGAGIGPVIDREALRAAGRVSSPAFRIGVAVPTVTWIPGVTRPPMRGVGGVWTGDVNRYPVLSGRDRRRIAFGPDDARKQSHVDKSWRKSADAAGVVILDTEAVDRDGKRGWRVMPTAAAAAIRKRQTGAGE